jgi:hypothetical protein
MKVALLCIAAIIVLIGGVALIVAMIGAMLPQRHVASLRVVSRPARVA